MAYSLSDACIGTIVEFLTRLRVELLPRPLPDGTIEFDVRRIQFWFTGCERTVETLDQPRHFVTIEVAVVIVQIIEVGDLVILGFVVASLNTPHIRPMRRRGMVRTEQVVGT